MFGYVCIYSVSIGLVHKHLRFLPQLATRASPETRTDVTAGVSGVFSQVIRQLLFQGANRHTWGLA